MLKIDALVSHPWYAEHVRPVWDALPEKNRGTLYTKAADLEKSSLPVLVAATGDMFVAHRLKRPIAMMEHGAGQSYGGDRLSRRHSSYAGGDSRFAELFLHPGPHPAARDAARYPQARVEIIGCPKLDFLPERDRSLDTTKMPVVAVSFHWDCQVSQETRSSFIWFRNALRLNTGFQVLGHGHPRMMERLRPWYARKGFEAVDSFSDVLKRADLYVCDNSSSLFEFASTGRPVVVLNPPFYRRDRDHGLRFWDAAGVGLGLSEPSAFEQTVLRALKDPESAKISRERALDLVYTPRTGAAALGAAAIIDWMETR